MGGEGQETVNTRKPTRQPPSRTQPPTSPFSWPTTHPIQTTKQKRRVKRNIFIDIAVVGLRFSVLGSGFSVLGTRYSVSEQCRTHIGFQLAAAAATTDWNHRHRQHHWLPPWLTPHQQQLRLPLPIPIPIPRWVALASVEFMFHTSRVYGLNVYVSGNNKLLKGFSTHKPTHAHTHTHREMRVCMCIHILRVTLEVSLATWNFTYTIASHFLPVCPLTLTTQFSDFPKTPTQ